jgi:hypothetical protein
MRDSALKLGQFLAVHARLAVAELEMSSCATAL